MRIIVSGLDSAEVSFKYDNEVLSIVKELPRRRYNPDKRNWVIPPKSIPEFCNNRLIKSQKVVIEFRNVVPGVYHAPSFKYKTTPLSHQIDGVKYGLENKRFILGDQPGLGKTKQIIDLAVSVKTPGTKCLIICGVNGLKFNWKSEVEKHSYDTGYILGQRFTKTGKLKQPKKEDKLYDLEHIDEIDSYFIITNIESLRLGAHSEGKGKKRKWFFPIADKLSELCDRGIIKLIAFDECHKAKNPDTAQGKALLRLKSEYMIAMSGTPQVNSPLDMYMPLSWLGYELHSYYQFKSRYCVFGGFQNSTILGYRHLKELRSIVDSVMLRRLRKDVLDLPDISKRIEYVEMSPAQEKIYNEIRSSMLEDVDKIYLSNNPAAKFTRLRQATGYTGLVSSTIQESAKLDRLLDIVYEYTQNGMKCIVFSNWERMVQVAKQYLHDYSPPCVTGSVSDSERIELVDKFQTDPDCKVICGTIGALGTGFTLTAANCVIFLDEPWNEANKEQAEDRAYRIGTLGGVDIITLVCKNTVDERVSDIINQKSVLSDFVVDGKRGSKSLVDFLLS